MPRPSTGRVSRGSRTAQVRLSADEARELAEVAKLLGQTESDVLRKGLRLVSEWLHRPPA
jgi:hypothetical protein